MVGLRQPHRPTETPAKLETKPRVMTGEAETEKKVSGNRKLLRNTSINPTIYALPPLPPTAATESGEEDDDVEQQEPPTLWRDVATSSRAGFGGT